MRQGGACYGIRRVGKLEMEGMRVAGAWSCRWILLGLWALGLFSLPCWAVTVGGGKTSQGTMTIAVGGRDKVFGFGREGSARIKVTVDTVPDNSSLPTEWEFGAVEQLPRRDNLFQRKIVGNERRKASEKHLCIEPDPDNKSEAVKERLTKVNGEENSLEAQLEFTHSASYSLYICVRDEVEVSWEFTYSGSYRNPDLLFSELGLLEQQFPIMGFLFVGLWFLLLSFLVVTAGVYYKRKPFNLLFWITSAGLLMAFIGDLLFASGIWTTVTSGERDPGVVLMYVRIFFASATEIAILLVAIALCNGILILPDRFNKQEPFNEFAVFRCRLLILTNVIPITLFYALGARHVMIVGCKVAVDMFTAFVLLYIRSKEVRIMREYSEVVEASGIRFKSCPFYWRTLLVYWLAPCFAALVTLRSIITILTDGPMIVSPAVLFAVYDFCNLVLFTIAAWVLRGAKMNPYTSVLTFEGMGTRIECLWRSTTDEADPEEGMRNWAYGDALPYIEEIFRVSFERELRRILKKQGSGPVYLLFSEPPEPGDKKSRWFVALPSGDETTDRARLLDDLAPGRRREDV